MMIKATELLVNQHREIEDLFERLDRADQGETSRVREELATALVAHSGIEKELFYKAIEQEMPEMVARSYEEHALVEYALLKLLQTRLNDPALKARTAVLEGLVNLHVREEETDLLKRVEGVMDEQEMQELGLRMMTRYEELHAQGYRRVLRKSVTEAMPMKKTAGRRVAKKAAGVRVAKKAAGVGMAKKGARKGVRMAKKGARAGVGMAKKGARKGVRMAKKGARAGAIKKATGGRRSAGGRVSPAKRRAGGGRKSAAGARARSAG